MSSQFYSKRSFKPCPECGGRRVRVQDKLGIGREIDMYLVQPERSLNFQEILRGVKSKESQTMTLTCIQCGYTAWYALSPLNLIPDE